MDELHHNIMKENDKENLIKSYASSHNMSVGSVRSFHSVNSSPRGSTTQYFNISSPRNMDTSTTDQPPVDPADQQHFFNVPEPPKQSISKKSKKKITKTSKFSIMTDTTFDEKQNNNKMNVDEAENEKQQKQTKSQKLQEEYEDMMDDIQTTKWKRKHQLLEEYENLMNDVNTSHSKRRIAEQEYAELMRDMNNPNFGGSSASGINEPKKRKDKQTHHQKGDQNQKGKLIHQNQKHQKPQYL